MVSLRRTIDIQVPIQTAYSHAVRIENLPTFINQPSHVTRVDEKRFRFVLQAASGETELQFQLLEQIPYTRIAWRGDWGMRGSLALAMLSDRCCRITVHVEPEEAMELDLLKINLEGCLARFKAFVEGLEYHKETPK